MMYFYSRLSFIFLLLQLMAFDGFNQVLDSIPNRDSSGVYKYDPQKIHVLYFKLDDGDSVPVVNLPQVEVMDKLNPLVVDNLKRYLKLKRDVIRAYPYAVLASETLKQINDTLSRIQRERQRKKYIKESEKIMKERFESDLRRLTINQGRILIKLVNRETGDTSYEIVKDLRGTFQALFWQSMARMFGSTLKMEYDPKGEDYLIEEIVQSIERGEIPVVKKTNPN